MQKTSVAGIVIAVIAVGTVGGLSTSGASGAQCLDIGLGLMVLFTSAALFAELVINKRRYQTRSPAVPLRSHAESGPPGAGARHRSPQATTSPQHRAGIREQSGFGATPSELVVQRIGAATRTPATRARRLIDPEG